MPRLVTLGGGIVALAVLIPVLVFALQPASDSIIAGPPQKQQGYSALEGTQTTFLPDHYDQRTGTFDPDGSGIFDDGADTLLSGQIPGLGKVTVQSSAAWDWATYTTSHPSALVYNAPITMPDDHKHAGCTVIGGGTHTFTATVTITKSDGDTITAAIVGGSNTERLIFAGAGHVPTCATLGGTPTSGSAFDGAHSETENTVTLVFTITAGTGSLAGSSGDGVLVYTYNTKEPHELLDAGIQLNLITP